MARENLEEWETNAYVEVQTIESTIRAYGRGEIDLPKVQRHDHTTRFADRPKCILAYNKSTIAEFLGWRTYNQKKNEFQPNHACNTAFEIIDAINLGIVKRDQFKKIKRDIAREIVGKAMALYREQERNAKQKADAAKKARDMASKEEDAKKSRSLEKAAEELERQADIAKESAEDVAKDFAKEMIGEVKSGNMSQRDVRHEGDRRKADIATKREKTVKDARQHLKKLRESVAAFLNEAEDEIFESILQLIEGDFGLESADIKPLREEVVHLRSRCDSFAKMLGAWRPTTADKSESSRSLKIVG
jgi:hypothetical protein